MPTGIAMPSRSVVQRAPSRITNRGQTSVVSSHQVKMAFAAAQTALHAPRDCTIRAARVAAQSARTV
eukprot:164340-Pyramimonas_sp.AAC.1